MPIKTGNESTLTFNTLISDGRTYLMGCAMISIMLFHEYFIPQYPITHFFRLYGHWGVEVFLLLSGFGIVHSLKKNSFKQYYINRAKRLIPTCILVGLCKLLLDRLGFIEIKTQNLLLLVTNIYLWFIYAIVVYYAIAPLIYHFLNRYSVATLCVICCLSVLGRYLPLEASPDYLISKLAWINARLPIFVFGMYIAVRPLKYSVKSIS